ncbi:MAG: hypothetical protein WBQ08_03405 [Candidatus Sulfotelmatobacter sp.]
MSRLFESFEYLDRGWDVRMLENCSLRRLFVWLMLLAFVLGMDVAVTAFQVFRFDRLNWAEALNLLTVGILAFRYSRLIYRRLS